MAQLDQKKEIYAAAELKIAQEKQALKVERDKLNQERSSFLRQSQNEQMNFHNQLEQALKSEEQILKLKAQFDEIANEDHLIQDLKDKI